MFQKFHIIHDKYTVIKHIGNGAQGVTYQLESTRTSGTISVVGKCIDDDLLAEHEAETLRGLKHRNVVKFLDYFTEANKYWIIMEYCDDGDLNTMLQTRRSNNSPLSDTEIVNIFVQIMESVRYLHSKLIVHRDIKPSNILLTAGTVKLGDFGIARSFDPNGPAIMTCIGTTPYMSPEILDNNGYSQSTDLWACGCVLYELCCLERLFASSNLGEIFKVTKNGKLPNLDEQYGGIFSAPFRELICLNPAERISAETFLKKYFTESNALRKHVLLVGMVGVGKSSLGNLIAGRDIFKTSNGVASCTIDHKVFRANDTGITIIDTMGMADPSENEAEIRRKISDALEATADGVDLIFFCMQLGRITPESYVVFQSVMTQFGNDCRPNLCLVLTRSGKSLVLGERSDLVAKHDEWIRIATQKSGEAGRMFRDIFNACSGKIIFIENPPNDEDSEQDIKTRDTCRQLMIQFIQSSTVSKFTSEAALRAREDIEKQDTFVMNMRNEIIEAKEQLKKQMKTAEAVQAECDKWKRRCQLQNEYDSMHRVYVEEKRRRDLAHGNFCPRKKCKAWSSTWTQKRSAKPSDEISNVSLITLWHQHCETCEGCKACRICFLENKLGELYANRDEIIRVIESGRCFSEISDVKNAACELEQLVRKEWTAHGKTCKIL